ncbi:hypothetical protein K469DRAFT_751526 [Zopfia rhizophila CBS 207.26]|uniref:Transmembrane protein n=1 Tax=Zopfia rhizophila CBS 207.26 TaxID=1314779 RepID=A0A6A6E001_9PEZI|nr:hypothetical protein K469DRAFT_751526 [Zopfia rhizophila CBS 207.26]
MAEQNNDVGLDRVRSGNTEEGNHTPVPRTTGEEDLATRFVNFLQGYLKAMLAISLFGGQITFTIILSDIYDPNKLSSPHRASFSKETVRLFVSISWMLFTFVLGLSAIAQILLSDSKIREVVGKGGSWTVVWMLFALNLMPVLAFLFLALAVTAFVPVVGWVVLGFVGLYAVVVVSLWWALDS